MRYTGIDHVVVAAPSAETLKPFERLGLRVTPALSLPEAGIERRSIVGGGRTNQFAIVFDSVVDAAKAKESTFGRLTQSRPDRAAVCALALRVESVEESLRELATRGVQATAEPIIGAGGRLLGRAAVLPERDDACSKLVLVDSVQAPAELHDELEQQGMRAHSLELKRLDHLAAVAPELEKTTAYWRNMLGIPVFGELVGGSGNIIRQMKIGDAILELLGPSGPDSPLLQRPPGLNSMTAFEVPDLDAAVATARAAGFSASDPATGSLPGTRVARIPGEELSGLTLQLLQYV